MRIKAVFATTAMVVAATGAAILPSSPAFAVSCPDNGWAILDGRVGQFFAQNFINIRTGPSTVCTSLGQGQMSHTAQVDCYKEGQNGTWTHLFDFNTGVEGWSKDSLLVGTGALVHC